MIIYLLYNTIYTVILFIYHTACTLLFVLFAVLFHGFRREEVTTCCALNLSHESNKNPTATQSDGDSKIGSFHTLIGHLNMSVR